jgi:hypothetical protein
VRRIRPNYLGHHLSGALRLTHSFRGQLTIHATPQRHKKMHRSYVIHSPDRPGIEVHDWRTNAETTIGPPNITSYCQNLLILGIPCSVHAVLTLVSAMHMRWGAFTVSTSLAWARGCVSLPCAGIWTSGWRGTNALHEGSCVIGNSVRIFGQLYDGGRRVI